MARTCGTNFTDAPSKMAERNPVIARFTMRCFTWNATKQLQCDGFRRAQKTVAHTFIAAKEPCA